LLGRHLEIAAFVVRFGPKKREQPGQRENHDQQQDKIEPGNRQNDEHRESHQPEPRRKRGDDAPAVQESDRHEIEQVEEKAAVGQAAEHQVAGGQVESLAQKRSSRTQQRSANAHDRLDPGVARRFLKQYKRTHKRDKHGRADLESESFGGQQMSAFVDEHQQHKSDRKPNAPKHRVNANGKDHGAAGFEQYREKFECGHQGKLEFGEQRDNGHADRSQRLLHLLAEAGTRRRLWRRPESIMGIFVLIHGGRLSELARPRENYSS
jgi:hypothetical protein